MTTTAKLSGALNIALSDIIIGSIISAIIAKNSQKIQPNLTSAALYSGSRR